MTKFENPSLFPRKQKLLILDLDGTLVSEDVTRTFRPNLKEFLNRVRNFSYDLAVWSAANAIHVNKIVQRLYLEVPDLEFKFIWSKEQCIPYNPRLLGKPLTKVYEAFAWAQPESTLILDNTPETYSRNIENAIPIVTYVVQDIEDDAFGRVLTTLNHLSWRSDVRPLLSNSHKK